MTAALTPSQTVGPFFGVGLPYQGSERMVTQDSPASVRIEGQVLDGNGDPVKDALIEVWEPSIGFGRARTDPEGAFHVIGKKPQAHHAPDGRRQAPYLNVTVFARGLLRHLVTRIYFPDEAEANSADPVLNLVDANRRKTLIAAANGSVLHFDIRLQGEDETVFFAI